MDDIGAQKRHDSDKSPRFSQIAMYLKFYNLTEHPFDVTPNPKFLYLTPQHATAINHLQFAILRGCGFALLTGEVGTGKTTICRRLISQFDERFSTALVLNPNLTATQLLRAIAVEFGIPEPPRDRFGCIQALNRFLLQANATGKTCVLIIDEAQVMSIELLETVRLLSNLETNSRKLLQIILVGQPELRKKLFTPALRQLAQRITVRYHLAPISRAETAEYLKHRLKIAGADGTIHLTEDAIDEIFGNSGGTPRLINAISDRALLAGYVNGTTRIDKNIVRLAIHDLKEAA